MKTEIKIENLRLEDILDMQHIRELNDAFAFSMNLASTVVDLKGNPIAGPSNHCHVCQLIRSNSRGLANCMESARILGSKAHETGQPYSSPCYSLGFADAAAPIIIQGKHIATWLVGQAYLAQVDENRIIEYSREIGVDENAMLRAFRSMKSIPPEEFETKLDFLWRIAQTVSTLGYNNLKSNLILERLRKSQSELEAYRQNLEVIVEKRTSQLKKALEKVEQLSLTDYLTGCFNRQYLHKNLDNELKRSKRYQKCLSIAICDIDHFKLINDKYGHQCGDHVLSEFAGIIRPNIRDGIDTLVRYGGEEFLLLLPETDLSGALLIADRLRRRIEETPIVWEETAIRITASFGIAAYDYGGSHQITNSDDLIMIADKNLYQAKANGRNVVFGPAQ